MLYVGEGPRGSNGACSTLQRISITPSSTHNQIGPLWCWFPSGWACAHSRPLWVSPTNSPVRLGVSPTAAPTPTGAFNQRSEALFPPCWSPGLRGLLRSPPFVQVYLCASVGPWSATHRSACPVLRHSESSPLSFSVCECGTAGSASGQTACPVPPTLPPVSVLPQQRESSPPLLPVWMNVYFLSPSCRTSLPFDFLSGLVVRGGAVCLPTPLSWFSKKVHLIVWKIWYLNDPLNHFLNNKCYCS